MYARFVRRCIQMQGAKEVSDLSAVCLLFFLEVGWCQLCAEGVAVMWLSQSIAVLCFAPR